MHGGRSTGPRTAEGKAARTAAHTTHGHRAAPKRKALRANRTLVRRMVLYAAVIRLGRYMPAAMMAGLLRYPLVFLPPEKPPDVVVSQDAPRTPYTCLPPLRRASRGRSGAAVGLALTGRAGERAVALAEAALQAPWQQAVAFARAVRRGVRAEKRDARAARRAARAAKRVVGTSTARGRGKSGETGAVRLNPTQLSRAAEAVVGQACGPGAGLGPSRGGRTDGVGVGGGRVDGGRVDGPRGGDAVGCGGARHGGERQQAGGAGLIRRDAAAGLDGRPALGLDWLHPASAFGGETLGVGGGKMSLRAQLAAWLGPAAPPPGWFVPRAWPPVGGLCWGEGLEPGKCRPVAAL